MDDDGAITTLEYLRDQQFKGQPVKARLKTENTFRSLYATALANTSTTSTTTTTATGQAPEQSEQAANYAAPTQNWADVGFGYVGYTQWENVDPNYKGYDNRRGGGYRKGGRNYSRGRGGYRGQGTKEGQNNQSNRRRRDSGGNPAVLQFTAQHFPPLPSQKEPGYTKEFKHYGKQEIVDVVSKLTDITKPELPADGKVVEIDTNTEILVMKPWPAKKPDSQLIETTPVQADSNPMSLPVTKESSPATEKK